MGRKELVLKRIKDSKIIRSYYYDELTLDLEEKKKLKTNFLDSNEYKLICNCNSNIEMKIDKNFKRIYPKEHGLKHSEGCIRNKITSVYNKAWKIDEDTEETSVSIDFSLNPNQSNKNKLEGVIDNKNIYPKNNYQSNGKVTISALVKNLNAQTWARRAFKGISYDNKFEFWRKLCYGESNLINLNSAAIVNGEKTKNLRKMLFNPHPHETSYIKGKETRFVYMYFSDFKDLNNGNFELTCIYQKSNGELGNYRFIVKYEKFYEALKSSNIDKDYLLNSENNFIISGFVFRNRFNRIEIFELAIIRCSRYGLFSESSYEAKFYSMLSDNNKIFFKPNRPQLGYKNYIPDAILLEPNINKEIFIEVFGFNSEEYRLERENKIKLIANELKDTHYLIYWDALDNKPMPTIEEIELELNQLKS